MYRIVSAEHLNPAVVRMEIEAPAIAKKILPGQFVIVRADDRAERIPLTMNDVDREAGTVTITFQIVGASTRRLAALKSGDEILDLVGPLGRPSELGGVKKACVVAGGLGVAIAYPCIKWLYSHDAEVEVICGFRSRDLICLEDEMRRASSHMTIVTDDGSNGNKGLVTEPLRALLEAGNRYDVVIAIGPLIMMKFVSQLTKLYNQKTVVSMNPIMIDGTGMCGGCRVLVGGQYMHACVDGPEFDGHEVDYDDTMHRSTMYRDCERQADEHVCRMLEAADQVKASAETSAQAQVQAQADLKGEA